jgi:plastocyanin
MRQALLPAALLFALALAGCSGKDKDADLQPVTCPDGTVLTSEQLEAFPDHHEAGFNATAHCPVPPAVSLQGIPASLGAFRSAAFSWTLDNGTVQHAHSMLTSIRWSERSIPDADLTNVNKYPSELVKREHQNLPVTYQGNMTFSKVGKVYLRAYMEVSGKDYWSPEVAVNITPVVPTGTVKEVDVALGGAVTPEMVDIVLGDAVQLKNDDLVAHTCSFDSGPASTAPFTAEGMGATSDAVVFVAPQVYSYACDDLQEHSFKVNVKVA